MNTLYKILESSTIRGLQKIVQVHLDMGAVLEGGVSTCSITTKSIFDNGPDDVCQCFYQAVSYDTFSEPMQPGAYGASNYTDGTYPHDTGSDQL